MQSRKPAASRPSLRRRTVLAGAAAAAVSAAVPLRFAAGQAKTLKIGVNLPRSGLQAQFGQDSVRGVELALEVLGAKGYPKVEIIHVDNETKPDIGRAQAEKLIDQGCTLILGCYDSGITSAVAQVCEGKSIPLVINVAAAPQITDGRFKTVFRNFPTGPMIASDAFLLQKEVYELAGKAPKSAVMLHVNDTFGTSQKDASVRLIGNFGMPYKFEDVISYDPAARDLSAEVRKAKGTNAELVWIITRLNDAILIVQEMVKQRWVPMGVVSTGPGPYDDPFLKQLGKLSDDIINLVPWFDPNKPMSKAMIAAWNKKFPDRTLNTSVSHSFEATLIALDAYKRAGSAEPAKLIEALQKTNIADNVTVGPAITFNDKGQNTKTRNSAIQNRGGKLVPVAPKEAAVSKPIWPMRAWNARG
jgi:branched-chain amino acid transport system substrate-binding protein